MEGCIGEGSKNVEFKKAFDTMAGGQVKVTGDPNKVSTYYSQIDVGSCSCDEMESDAGMFCRQDTRRW
eukprot:680258-Hanusia_phi.AAC.2